MTTKKNSFHLTGLKLATVAHQGHRCALLTELEIESADLIFQSLLKVFELGSFAFIAVSDICE